MSLFSRDLTQGQLAALVLVKVMATGAAGGEGKMATKFMVLFEKRRWEGLAAVAFMLSSDDISPSPSDFRAVSKMPTHLQDAYFSAAALNPETYGRCPWSLSWFRAPIPLRTSS